MTLGWIRGFLENRTGFFFKVNPPGNEVRTLLSLSLSRLLLFFAHIVFLYLADAEEFTGRHNDIELPSSSRH